MNDKKLITLSVQDLLEFSQQSGDIKTGFCSPARAVEGTKGHNTARKLFIESLPADSVYESEVPISYKLEGESTILEIAGRMDGVLKDASGITIHEIKTTFLPLDSIEHDHNPIHWAQAKCYGFMFSCLYGLDYIAIRLTYFQPDTKQEKSFIDIYSFDTLEDFFMPLVRECAAWQDMICGRIFTRDASINKLDFPYGTYRAGQQELIDSVYESIRRGDILFAQAPTGTGKTIATLYPSVKAMGDGHVSKIFYLTAKTTTRGLAEKAIDDMRDRGLRIKSLTITAKEKICFCKSQECDPDTCEFASNYYGKLRKALLAALEEDRLDKPTIESYARKYAICPFELSLDLSLWCDVIICDYNYLFDPRVYLKRFFTRSGEWCFLIDEAHNLVDRARDMFSSELSKRTFFELNKAARNEYPELCDYAGSIYKYFTDTARSLNKEQSSDANDVYAVRKEPPNDLYRLLERFTDFLENRLSRGSDLSFIESLTDTYFDCLNFMKILELYDDKFVTCYDKTSKDLKIKLFCVDPSKLLRKSMDKGRASVLFSATLSPMEYYTSMLGGGRDSRMLTLASPFPPENLCVYVYDTISTKFKARQFSYDQVAKAIFETANAKTGNYIAFFPSFEYLNQVYCRFMGIAAGIRTLYQTPGMSEASRQEFLDEFGQIGETSLVGFAVMGGVFGEGIDLVGDKLSGAIIVGVGLPQICNERNIIRQYFDELLYSGYEYAYIYPGLNRVLQAAGRVIRTEDDTGVVILIDERFSHQVYRELLPSEWPPILRASEGCDLKDILRDFWDSFE